MHVTKVDVWWDAAQHTTLDISHFEKLPFHKKDDFSHSLPTRAFHPSPTSPPPPPPQLPVAPKHFKLQANRKQAGESYHDRQITMLQHYTNWPQAYRESVLFSSVVFWDVRAKVRKVEKWQSKECLEQCFVVKPQSTNDLLGSLFHFLFVHLISTQLSPAPSLFLSFWSNSSSYFDSNNYPHQLKETLSSLTELRSLQMGQTRSANCLVEKVQIIDCEVTPVKLSTVPLPVSICHTDLRACVNFLCSEGIFCWHTYHWTDI